MLVFEERGKPEYPEKNLSEQSREPTNSAHLWRRVRESNPDTLVEGERSHHYANPATELSWYKALTFLRLQKRFSADCNTIFLIFWCQNELFSLWSQVFKDFFIKFKHCT